MRLKKSIVAILLACIVGVMVFALTACNDDDFRNERNGEPEAGQFYTLQQAYDNGWLSKGDLRNIAYYFNGDKRDKKFNPKPKTPDKLSTEIQNKIKDDYIKNILHEEDVSIEHVNIFNYYGTYDGFVAIGAIDDLNGYDLIVEPEYYVGDVVFYDYSGVNLRLWYGKNN